MSPTLALDVPNKSARARAPSVRLVASLAVFALSLPVLAWPGLELARDLSDPALGGPGIPRRAVQLERDAGGTITGAIRGTPSYREGKVQRVGQWLHTLGRGWGDFSAISVYSDSLNDLPLLERAHHPVATNPSPALEALARERHWRILRLFDDQEIH